MWQYKTGYLRASNKDLDAKLNDFGVAGWEIFSLVSEGKTNEMSSTGEAVFVYRIMMKKPIEK